MSRFANINYLNSKQMKKKTFFALMVAALGILAAHASISYRTSCGTTGQTVGADFFESQEAYESYLKELNLIDCGTDELPIVTHDSEPTTEANP